ncbi:MAG: hypothetical protein ACC682_13860 [Gemmatimonadota bacterium]
MRVRTRFPAALVVGALAVLMGCDDNDIAGPLSRFNSFTILVEVTDVGVGADPNGFVVTVSPGDVTERVGVGELLRVPVPKTDTPYSVTLSEVAGNCHVEGEASRSIRVRVRDQSTLARRADFVVECS